MKKSVATLLLLVAFSASAEVTMNYNGQNYECNGNLTINNDVVACNGQIISGGSISADSCMSDIKTACGYEKVQIHPNGEGTISICAAPKVDSSVYISPTSIVCGTVELRGNVRITNGSVISGSVEVTGSTEIRASTISGSSDISNSVIDETVISGSADITSSSITRTTISGSADISDSVIKLTRISGSSDIENSHLSNRTISGSDDFSRVNDF